MKKLSLSLLLLPLLSFGQYSKQFPLDKQAHFLAGSTISGVTYALVLKKTKNPKKAFIYSLITPLVIGTAKEIYDSRQPTHNKGFDGKDLGATVLGGLSVSFVLKIF
jgi:uncharacterized protein YfiM (DUF2279 family)